MELVVGVFPLNITTRTVLSGFDTVDFPHV
jgi:hypothetical protein